MEPVNDPVHQQNGYLVGLVADWLGPLCWLLSSVLKEYSIIWKVVGHNGGSQHLNCIGKLVGLLLNNEILKSH